MAFKVRAYLNYLGRLVVSNCPDAGGDHSHFLGTDDENIEQFIPDDAGGGSYICHFAETPRHPGSSGERIQVTLIPESELPQYH